MSGVSMDENLFCKTCKKVTVHHTDWDSEHPMDVYAQCIHFGPRMISGEAEAREIKGKRNIYWFLLDRNQS